MFCLVLSKTELMYQSLTFLHSTFRWIALLLLLITIIRFAVAKSQKKPFSKSDNALRHWTATSFHIQLILGLFLYFYSPIVQLFWDETKSSLSNLQITFFAIIHSTGMFMAIFMVTMGSIFAKKAESDQEKFSTALSWFVVALIIILVLIPWPFSPLAARPYFR